VESVITTHTLSVNSSGASSVSITGSPSTYSGTTNYSKYNITSGTSNTFSSWSGTGCSSSNRTITVSMTANRTCTANYTYTPTTYTLNVKSSGASSVSITGSPSTYSGTTNYSKYSINSGTSITLTAPSTKGSYTFSSWSGTGCSSSNRTITVSMTANRTCTANYTYTAPSCSGSLSCADETESSIKINYSFSNCGTIKLYRGSTYLKDLSSGTKSGSYNDTGLSSGTSYTYYLKEGSSQIASKTCTTDYGSAPTEDPATCTEFNVSPTTINKGESVSIKVSGQDDNGMNKVCYIESSDSSWNCYSCSGTSCSKTWSRQLNNAGTYYFYGGVEGKKSNGTNESFKYCKNNNYISVTVQSGSNPSDDINDCAIYGVYDGTSIAVGTAQLGDLLAQNPEGNSYKNYWCKVGTNCTVDEGGTHEIMTWTTSGGSVMCKKSPWVCSTSYCSVENRFYTGCMYCVVKQ